MATTEAQGKKEKSSKFWLYAFRDHLAHINAYTNCIDTVDVSGDGDYKLVVADGSKKMKQFGGTSMIFEAKLPNVPSAVTSFYADFPEAASRPVIAVAIGSFVYMYANNKPLYRCGAPEVAIDPTECQVWEELRAGNISVELARGELSRLVDAGVEATTRTLEFLLLAGSSEREEFAARLRGTPIRQLDFITCLASLPLNSEVYGSPGCLVMGTERRMLYILHSNASDIDHTIYLPSAPVSFITAGCYQVEYRIIASCRDGRIYSVKNGALHTSVIQPDAQPSAMTRFGHLIAVGTTMNTLSYYTLKGKRQQMVFLPTTITNLATITDPVTDEARAVVAALGNGEIRVYSGKSLIHVSQAFGIVTAMKYGRYGREDSALLIVLQNGSLVVELLHRKANLNAVAVRETGPPPEQDEPIPVPRLSSVFTAQSDREISCCTEMYRSFQHDLCHLRLHTARTYLSVLAPTERAATVVTPQVLPQMHQRVHLVTAVQGLGPVFKLKISVENVQKNSPLLDVVIAFVYDTHAYHMPVATIAIPYLVSSVMYPVEARIELVEGETKGDPITVLALSRGSPHSLGSVVIELPEADIVQGV